MAASRAELIGVQALLIDLDGVIYRGNQPLPGADRLLPELDQLGIDHVFVTNNSTLTPEDVVAKLATMSVVTDTQHVMTSALATMEFLRPALEPGASVLVVGEEGLQAALVEAGFRLVDKPPCAAVVSGLDRTLTYERLANACLAIRSGARYVATNADPAIPVEDGFWPGAGAIVAALTACTNVEPEVIGKPAPALLEFAMKRIGARPETTAMVGDQISSDIKAGAAAGTRTILIGHDQSTPDAEPRPTVWVNDLAELLAALGAAR